jgi:hypothetical protein
MKRIIIEQFSNGYVIKSDQQPRSFNEVYAPEILAVFNHLDGVNAWLAENFRLPNNDGGAA